MAARLGRPLYTVACHDDLSAADLIGRWLLKGGETIWVDGPLTRAVREGAICYLDEVVEARKDVTVVLHPLTDDRRILPIDRTGEELEAHPDFLLVASYNPGYQNILKTLKPSTRQRFVPGVKDGLCPQSSAGSAAFPLKGQIHFPSENLPVLRNPCNTRTTFPTEESAEPSRQGPPDREFPLSESCSPVICVNPCQKPPDPGPSLTSLTALKLRT
jgi:hypothetical protein